MTEKGGRVCAIVSACSALVVLGSAIYIGREWLAEAWYLRLLGSQDEKTRLSAAEKLGNMGSLKAAPVLLEIVRSDSREEAFPPAFSHNDTVMLTPALHALYRIGPKARDLVEDERQWLADVPFGAPLESRFRVVVDTRAVNQATTTLNQGPGFWAERAECGLESVLQAWERGLDPIKVSLGSRGPPLGCK